MTSISLDECFVRLGVPKKAVKCFYAENTAHFIIAVTREDGTSNAIQFSSKDLKDDSKTLLQAMRDQAIFYHGSEEAAVNAALKWRENLEERKATLALWTQFGLVVMAFLGMFLLWAGFIQ